MSAAAWQEITTHPMFGITLTLGVFVLAERLWWATGRRALLTPVMTTIGAIVATLVLTGVPYEAYFTGAGYIDFLLAPATVALAVTIYRNLPLITEAAAPIIIAVITGSAAGVASGFLVTKFLGGSENLAVSIMSKSVTTPVAMALTERAGGTPELTAAFTMITGMIGAVGGPLLMKFMRLKDQRVRGLAMGISSHGIGTAQSLLHSETEGAFAALGMALSAIAASIFMPLFVSLVL